MEKAALLHPVYPNSKAESSCLTFSTQEKLARLQLIRTETIGPITFHTLIKRFGSAQEAIGALPTLAQRGGRLKPLPIPSLDDIHKEWQALDKFGGSFIFYGETCYPPLLTYLEDAPPVVAIKGDPSFLKMLSFAIIGARNASLNGRQLARTFAQEMGLQGFVIVSGLARGIDTAAHEGALGTGTIAVLAGGINVIYPPENKVLYDKISQEGLLIAESRFGYTPQASSFPRRNRLISGLSKGILVVEAALKSGSLITATYATEQGRDVFAIPGFPLDPRCQGSNKLIQEGACLVQSTQDILNNLSSCMKEVSSPPVDYAQEISQDYPEATLAKIREKILETLNFSPLHIDELVRECHSSAAHVHLILLEMDVAGLLCRHPGHQVSLRLENNN